MKEEEGSFGKGLALFSQQKVDEGWNAAIEHVLKLVEVHDSCVVDRGCLVAISRELKVLKRPS